MSARSVSQHLSPSAEHGRAHGCRLKGKGQPSQDLNRVACHLKGDKRIVNNPPVVIQTPLCHHSSSSQADSPISPNVSRGAAGLQLPAIPRSVNTGMSGVTERNHGRAFEWSGLLERSVVLLVAFSHKCRVYVWTAPIVYVWETFVCGGWLKGAFEQDTTVPIKTCL